MRLKPDNINDNDEIYEHYHLDVDKGQRPLRIDKYLVGKLENISRNRIQNAAGAGNILVNNKPVKSNYKVKPADTISIVMSYPPREIEIIPENIPLDILYEDEQVIVLNKKAGMVVHPGHGNLTGTLVNALYYHFKDLPLFQSGEIRAGLVHRLDKDTSGLLVIAKTDMAHNHLAKQFFNRTIGRKYLAIVWGEPKKAEGTIKGNIGRNPKDRVKMHVFPDGSQGKHAISHYKVLEYLGYISLVECKLETGRTHQIRVHFKYLNHPVFNDKDYGGDRILRGTTFSKYRQFVKNCFKILPRQALHAQSLEFVHPLSGKKLVFDSSLPEDMASVIEKWKKYIENRI